MIKSARVIRDTKAANCALVLLGRQVWRRSRGRGAGPSKCPLVPRGAPALLFQRQALPQPVDPYPGSVSRGKGFTTCVAQLQPAPEQFLLVVGKRRKNALQAPAVIIVRVRKNDQTEIEPGQPQVL